MKTLKIIPKSCFLWLLVGLLSNLVVCFAQNEYYDSRKADREAIFLPDLDRKIITQFELKDGRIIRGHVERIVMGQLYEVKLYNRQYITIKEQEIVSKYKVVRDMRELRFGYQVQGGVYSTIPVPSSGSGLAFGFGLSYDFGDALKYSIMYSTFGANLSEEDYAWYVHSLLIGYKHRRLKEISQSYYTGLSFFNSNFTRLWLFTTRFELPLTTVNKYQLVPTISYYLPLKQQDLMPYGFVLGGVTLRIF